MKTSREHNIRLIAAAIGVGAALATGGTGVAYAAPGGSDASESSELSSTHEADEVSSDEESAPTAEVATPEPDSEDGSGPTPANDEPSESEPPTDDVTDTDTDTAPPAEETPPTEEESAPEAPVQDGYPSEESETTDEVETQPRESGAEDEPSSDGTTSTSGNGDAFTPPASTQEDADESVAPPQGGPSATAGAAQTEPIEVRLANATWTGQPVVQHTTSVTEFNQVYGTMQSALAAQQTQMRTAADTIGRQVTAALALFGLPGLPIGQNPVAPAAPPLAWALVTWSRRFTSELFFNATPVAAGSVTTGQDPNTGQVTGYVSARDADHTRLTYTVTDQPDQGTVVVDRVTGAFVYTPNPGTAADGIDDSFIVTASDANNPFHLHLGAPFQWFRSGAGHTTTVPVRITTGPTNTAPISTAPATVGGPDPTTGAVVITPNLSDPNGDLISYSLAGSNGPSGGTLVNNGNGTLTYTPSQPTRHAAAATTTSDSETITLTASDGRGGAVPVTVSFTVVLSNAAPTSTQSPVVGAPDPVTGAVIITPNLTDPDGDALTYTLAGSNALNPGTLVRNGNGTLTYTPSQPTRHDAAGTTGPDTETITVIADDGHGSSVPLTVGVTVAPSNDAPDFGGPILVFRPDATTGAVHIRPNLTDPNRDPVTYTVTSSNATTPGTLIDLGEGLYSYTPSDETRHNAAAATSPVTETIVLTGDDGHGSTVPVTVTFTVVPANEAPVGSEYLIVSAPDPITGAVIITPDFTDPDGDPLTYSVTSTTEPTAGTLVNNGNGTLTYTPTAETRHAAAQSTLQSYEVLTLTATDGHGGATPSTVIVPLVSTNTTPTSTGPLTVGLPDPNTGAVLITPNLTDADGDPITYQLTNGTGFVSGFLVDNGNGTLTYTPSLQTRHDAAASTTPVTDTMTFTATDGHGGTVALTATLTIVPANAPIVSTQSPTVGAPNPTTGAVVITPNLTDPDYFDVITYTVSSSTGVTPGTLVRNANGTLTYTPSLATRHAAAATTTPDTETITIVADDGHGSTVPLTVTFTVQPANAAPYNIFVATVGTPDPTTGAVVITPRAIDPDGDPLTYSLTSTSGTTLGTLVDNGNGTYTYTPTLATRLDAAEADVPAFNKVERIVITASDGHGGSVDVSVSVPFTSPYTTGSIDLTGAYEEYVETPDRTYFAMSTYDSTTSTGQVTIFRNSADGDHRTFAIDGDPGSIAISEDGAVVAVNSYNAATGEGQVTIIDTATGSARTVTLAGNPVTLVISNDGRYVAAIESDSLSRTRSATLIETATGTTTTVQANGNIQELEISDDGEYLVVRNVTFDGSNSTTWIRVLENSTGATTTFSVAGSSSQMAVSTDGSTILVTTYRTGDAGDLTILDTASGSQTRTSITYSPRDVLFSTDGTRAIVVSEMPVSGSYPQGGAVTIVDIDTGEARIIPTGSQPSIIETADGTTIYASGAVYPIATPVNGRVTGTIAVIDLDSGDYTTVEVDRPILSQTLGYDASTFYTVYSGGVVIVEPDGSTKNLQVGVVNSSVDATLDGRYVYVAHWSPRGALDESSMSIVEVATGDVTTIVLGEGRTELILATPSGDIIYVVTVHDNGTTTIATVTPPVDRPSPV
ncbi:tandem-95 repeat protein [Rhodococcus sp. P1Y]|uniref:tandem-95 repeat protein n=1 Tax=Rhodococcus sp. P1Y TaxID=1302308 RepID=UPI001293D70C|nr:tandem-95 repeat protein [Rhodococcus sp. P1Y]